MAIGAGQLLGEGKRLSVFLASDKTYRGRALGKAEGCFKRVCQSPENAWTSNEPINNNGNVVLILLFELWRVAQLDEFTINECT